MRFFSRDRRVLQFAEDARELDCFSARFEREIFDSATLWIIKKVGTRRFDSTPRVNPRRDDGISAE